MAAAALLFVVLKLAGGRAAEPVEQGARVEPSPVLLPTPPLAPVETVIEPAPQISMLEQSATPAATDAEPGPAPIIIKPEEPRVHAPLASEDSLAPPLLEPIPPPSEPITDPAAARGTPPPVVVPLILAAETAPEPVIESSQVPVERELAAWFEDLDLSETERADILEALPDETRNGAYDTLAEPAARMIAAAFALTDLLAGAAFADTRGRPATAALVDRVMGDHEALIWPDAGARFERTRHEAVAENGAHTVKTCIRPGLATASGVFRALVTAE
jgi:hypothetical protein